MKLGLLMCLCLAIHPVQASPNIEITQASIVQSETGNGYVLNAAIDYQLSHAAIEALENGVALTINVSFKIFRPRRWAWDEVLQRSLLVYQLRYRTLTRIYQVVNVQTGTEANYSSLGTAVRALGHLENIPVSPDVLKGHLNHVSASLQARLNIEALPLPMRPLAYITPAWHHSSEPYIWPLLR